MSYAIHSVNKDNQLIIKSPSESKFEALREEFKIDKGSSLIYLVNEPKAWYRKYNIPDKIEFEGKWSLFSPR